MQAATTTAAEGEPVTAASSESAELTMDLTGPVANFRLVIDSRWQLFVTCRLCLGGMSCLGVPRIQLILIGS